MPRSDRVSARQETQRLSFKRKKEGSMLLGLKVGDGAASASFTAENIRSGLRAVIGTVAEEARGG